jgi:medium-chain acyl-[acyl-carrier-protein] hydrolase
MALADMWITAFTKKPHARLRLFCFPHAGAGALTFRPWTSGLPAECEVNAIQLPGREMRMAESPITDLSALVSTLTGVLYPYRLDKPFAFFGHSLGALIAFELARNLRNTYNLSPIHLFASGRIAPHLKDARPPIHALSKSEFVDKLRELNGTPDEVLDSPEMAPLLHTLRADFALNEAYSYQPGPPLGVPISAFGGVEDTKVSEQELMGWQMHTSKAFKLRMFPGDHFFINSARAAVLQAIVQELSFSI